MISEKTRGLFLRVTPVAVGAILLVGSALLAVSILLAMFPLSPGTGFFSVPGRILYSVYGLSSFFVPCFFLFAVVLIVIPGWTARSGVMLGGSFLPFFTLVVGERMYRTLGLADSTSALAPAISIGLVVTVILAVVVEYLLLLLLGDLVFPRIRAGSSPDLDYGDDGFADQAEARDLEVAAVNQDDQLEYEDWVNSPDDEDGVVHEGPTANAGIAPETSDIDESAEVAEFVASVESVEPATMFESTDDTVKAESVSPIGEADELEELDALDEIDAVDDIDVLDEIDVVDELDEIDAIDEIDAVDPDEIEEAFEVEPVVVSVPPVRDAGTQGSGSAGARSHTPAPSRRFPSYGVPYDVLNSYPDGEYWIIDDATRRSAAALKETLNEFNIQADVTGIRKGPVITMFEILPAPGVKLSKIVSLQDNIALRLAASSVRIVAPIPGKHAVGIEVPNQKRAIVSFREIIEHDTPAVKKMEIPVILGKDIAGEAQLLDLAQTPHLLIAGSTGSGKSVCVNAIILSILYKRSPEDVRLILIDPKIVELKLYNDIGHLLSPVITEPKRAFQSLQYCLCEMERRYALLDGMGVRDIKSYNHRIKERKIATEKLPYIVVIIDEFADLMATTGKELESTVARLCAMSRAVGIHMVLATQRPSIDVITGLIKANIPTRIAFMVASKMDSRIIIDQVGAEKLLGRGDMLYSSATDPFPVRIQGAYVSEEEVERVVEHVRKLGEPEYIDEEMFIDDDEDSPIDASLFGDGEDPLYDKALEIVMLAGKASASYIQRKLKIGYNRAARLVEDMEARGIVGPANGSKPRDVIHHV